MNPTRPHETNVRLRVLHRASAGRCGRPTRRRHSVLVKTPAAVQKHRFLILLIAAPRIKRSPPHPGVTAAYVGAGSRFVGGAASVSRPLSPVCVAVRFRSADLAQLSDSASFARLLQRPDTDAPRRPRACNRDYAIHLTLTATSVETRDKVGRRCHGVITSPTRL